MGLPASALLTRHRDVLAALPERLEAEETIERPDLDSLMALVRSEVMLFGSVVRGEDAPAAPVSAEGV